MLKMGMIMTEYQQEKYSTFWSNCKQNKTYYPHTHVFLFNVLRILDKTFHKGITTLIKFVCVNKQLKNKRHGAILFLYTVGPYLLFTPFHHCLNKFTHDFCSHFYLPAIYLSFSHPHGHLLSLSPHEATEHFQSHTFHLPCIWRW